ncbi:MAG: hypothetical protein CVU13_10640 [Bacteroidetes bacterium HGW-Bacteroidetes-8]|jgi:hypothetical protein|nr:MAG: hypothetical protein CVU13_10640 [Bacteroidetes bacterium HGW-Bacteroidetes-8]
MVVDLHIEKIARGYKAFAPKDTIDYQKDHFIATLNRYSRQKGLKIDFVHGVGKGVLREELISILKNRFTSYVFEDAPFAVYGFQGALRVTIK